MKLPWTKIHPKTVAATVAAFILSLLLPVLKQVAQTGTARLTLKDLVIPVMNAAGTFLVSYLKTGTPPALPSAADLVSAAAAVAPKPVLTDLTPVLPAIRQVVNEGLAKVAAALPAVPTPVGPPTTNTGAVPPLAVVPPVVPDATAVPDAPPADPAPAPAPAAP